MTIRVLGVLTVAATLNGCGAARLPVASLPEGVPRARSVLYLIGDAGDAASEIPVLVQLRDELLSLPVGVSAVVSFLGDNVYGAGVRDADDPGFAADSARMETQVNVVRGTPARGIFVPGNHDWADGGRDGLRRMRNQTAFLRRRAMAGIAVEMLPADGCPGPRLLDLGNDASLVFIDTHWWLHSPEGRINTQCPNQTGAEVIADLHETLAGLPAGRRAVVLGHHPLETFGQHGGYFSAKHVFFPLTEIAPWLYVPIPFLYPMARNAGVTPQDLSNPKNRAMREALMGVFERHDAEPFVFAAGHEHTLQVMDGTPFGTGTHVVSGAGSKLDPVYDVGRSLFLAGEQHRERGFMKLEFFGDGTAQLSVFTDGTASCEAACLDGPVLRYTARLR
jgi:hypothetical protein